MSMKPALHAIVAKVRASNSWPDLQVFSEMLLVSGATIQEAASLTRSYRTALFSGRWPDELSVSAEDEFMAAIRAFSLAHE